MFSFNQSITSSQTPYIVPTDPDVAFVSIVTVGDPMPTSGGTTPFVGIPDGLGAYDNGDGTITLLVNHELGAASGAVQDHGSTGAFIDRLIIDKTSLAVVGSEDLIQVVVAYDTTTDSWFDAVGTPANALARLCSGNLAEVSAFFDAETGLGTQERIYIAGEEVADGRGFAFIATGDEAGTAWELPHFGNISYENAVAAPGSGDRTVVINLDDTSPLGQVYVYVGEKQEEGNTIERAGLVGGELFGIKVTGVVDETALTTFTGGQTTFSLVPFGDVSDDNAATLQADSEAAGITEFLRPEDGAWDPTNPNAFYFVTTGNVSGPAPGGTGPSRLYRLDFFDVEHPELGGTITMLLDGTEGQLMMDNLDVNDEGLVIIQEDPGNNVRLAKIWEYNPYTDTLTEVAQHDPARFSAPTPPFSRDEESSGVIDVSDLFGREGEKVYLLDVQAHYPAGATLVEGGQLLLMTDDTITEAPTEGPGRFAVADTEVSESGPLVFTINRGEGSTGAASVDFTLNLLPGGATADDFAPGTLFTGTVNFADGQTSQTVSFDLANDGAIEGDELVGLTLSNATGVEGIQDPVALVVIEDDDGITESGSRHADDITGTAGADRLSGQNGTDTLAGEGGSDLLDGGNAVDTLDGGDGDDVLRGGNGDDVLDGGAGEDILWGDRGDDRLTGGVDADIFVVAKSNGNDVVTDFYAALDAVGLSTGIALVGSTVADVDLDGTDDLVLEFNNGGGTLTLLGVDDIGQVQFVTI